MDMMAKLSVARIAVLHVVVGRVKRASPTHIVPAPSGISTVTVDPGALQLPNLLPPD